ncbi:putative DNA helicase [Helianthus annuus]|nr:putative DNA helicase [Helianthus annuus]
MLWRVEKDVVSELSGKTEITVHCKLSSWQRAFYQAIKNKISLLSCLTIIVILLKKRLLVSLI